MASGILPLDAIFALGRSAAAIPEGVRQHGARGAFSAFLNPRDYEQAATARGVREERAPDLDAIDQALDGAMDENDLAPIIGQFMRLQGELHAAGTVQDEAGYNRVLGPVQAKIQAKAREIGLVAAQGAGDDAQQAASAVRLGALTGDKNLQQAGQTLQGLFRSRVMSDQTQALMDQRAAAAPGQAALTDARTRAANAQAAKAEADVGDGDLPQPRLADLDRLDREIRTTTGRAGQFDPRTGAVGPAPAQPLVDERNARAAELGRPPLFPLPAGGTGYETREVSPEAAPVARQLLYGASPYVPPVEDGAPPPMQAAPQQQAIPAPAPVLSGRALAEQMMREQGISYDEAKARVRALIAQQGQAGANPR